MNRTTENQASLARLILREAYPALGCALFFSLFINLLMLTVPLYMLQLFDRVLTSQSIETLIYLSLIAVFALVVMSLLDVSRSRMLLRIGQWLDQRFGVESLSRSVDNKLRGGNYSQQCLNDVSSIRQLCSGSSVFAFFDAPWIIIYVLIIYFLSVPLGIITTVGAFILSCLAYTNERISRLPNQKANELYAENSGMVSLMLKNSETIKSMGMQGALIDLWFGQNNHFLDVQKGVIQQSNLIIASAKLIRLILQILILGVGAFYVIKGELSAGGMIAASIIMGRGLAPIEQGMSAWKALLDSSAAFSRLNAYLQPIASKQKTPIAQPEGVIQVEDVSFTVEGRPVPILQNIKFTLGKGKQLAIIGPIAAGKSTLARVLMGIVKPTFGSVRLDGVDVYQISDEQRGALLGYLSQVDALFPGTIRDNIDRLSIGQDEDIIKAAETVGVHQVIMRLPHGYETIIADYSLSVGQRQRIALARAFYGNPCFIVLDEPESNLDADGVLSVRATLQRARESHTSVVFVTQNPELARTADFALVLKQGRVQEYGPAATVVKQWLGT